MRYSPAVLIGLLTLTGSLMAGPVLFSVTPVALPTGYTLADVLPTLNNSGQVAGVANGPGNTTVPFITTGNSSVAVPFPTSLQNNAATNIFINDSGQIAGGTQGSSGNGPAYFGTASGVSFVPGTDIGVVVNGLNDSGVFVGDTVGAGGAAYVGNSAGITAIPYFFAVAINNAGQVVVVGPGSVPPLFNAVTSILTGSTPAMVPTPFPGVGPSGLNDADQVVGSGEAFVSTTAGFTLIPPISGFANNFGSVFINDHGVVVGVDLSNAGNGGFIWDPVDGTRQLSTLLPTGWTIISADGINDSGQIVALGSFMGGATEAVLLDPLAAPEPSTISMMLATIAFFATIHFARRRLQTHNVVARVDE
jgi:hypothetical protein